MMAEESETSPSEATGDQPVILIIDDSRLIRHALTKILSKHYKVIEAPDGEEGWEVLNNDPSIQIVISDLSMPHLDGIALLKRIRTSDKVHVKNVPFIVITGNEDDEAVKSKAMAYGASDFVGKPFNSIEIRTRISTFLRHQETNLKLKEISASFEEHTTVDPVTKLSNPRYFFKRGKQNLSFAMRHSSSFSIIYVQIDQYESHIKPKDQTESGAILTRLGELLSGRVREEDTVSYLGKGKFGILLPASNLIGASKFGERVLTEVQALSFDKDVSLSLTASIGVTALEIKPGFELKDMIRSVDERVKMAVDAGGNKVINES